jgi:hypothetical protein
MTELGNRELKSAKRIEERLARHPRNRPADRLLQTFHALGRLTHSVKELSERNPLLGTLELRCISQFMWAGPQVFLPG